MTKQNSLFTDSNGELSRTQTDWIYAKLESAEKSGFTQETKEQILAQSKSLRND